MAALIRWRGSMVLGVMVLMGDTSFFLSGAMKPPSSDAFIILPLPETDAGKMQQHLADSGSRFAIKKTANRPPEMLLKKSRDRLRKEKNSPSRIPFDRYGMFPIANLLSWCHGADAT